MIASSLLISLDIIGNRSKYLRCLYYQVILDDEFLHAQSIPLAAIHETFLGFLLAEWILEPAHFLDYLQILSKSHASGWLDHAGFVVVQKRQARDIENVIRDCFRANIASLSPNVYEISAEQFPLRLGYSLAYRHRAIPSLHFLGLCVA